MFTKLMLRSFSTLLLSRQLKRQANIGTMFLALDAILSSAQRILLLTAF